LPLKEIFLFCPRATKGHLLCPHPCPLSHIYIYGFSGNFCRERGSGPMSITEGSPSVIIAFKSTLMVFRLSDLQNRDEGLLRSPVFKPRATEEALLYP